MTRSWDGRSCPILPARNSTRTIMAFAKIPPAPRSFRLARSWRSETSYTAGSEVMDNETWPAQLEQRLGQPVLNAGVGGYGVDQVVLNAERLLPIVKPRAVIVGIHEDSIQRTTYKTFSTPKPYFIEEGGGWVVKNQPVPAPEGSTPEPLYKRALARLVTAHLLFNRVAHDWWFSTGGQRFERTANDPGREVCFLLSRLQDRLRTEHIPGLVVVQYYGWSYWRSRPRDAATQEVLACARRSGYAVSRRARPHGSNRQAIHSRAEAILCDVGRWHPIRASIQTRERVDCLAHRGGVPQHQDCQRRQVIRGRPRSSPRARRPIRSRLRGGAPLGEHRL